MPKRTRAYRPDGTYAHDISVYTRKEIDALLGITPDPEYDPDYTPDPDPPPTSGSEPFAQGNGVNLVCFDHTLLSYGPYWTGGTNATITQVEADEMALLGIKHVRLGLPSVYHPAESDTKFRNAIIALQAAGIEVSYSTWGQSTGYDPTPVDIAEAAMLAENLAKDFPNLIHNVWNEPGGKHQQSFYGHHQGLDAIRTGRWEPDLGRWVDDRSGAETYPWVEWNRPIVEDVLAVNPSARFIFDDTHWGQGAQGSSSMRRSALSLLPTLVARTGLDWDQVCGSIHYYETWEDDQLNLYNLLDSLAVEHVRFGEFGGDPNFAARGKGPAHHSNLAYKAGLQCLDFTHPKVRGADIWHGGQSWWSGFCISDEKDQGRRYPWLIDFDNEPLTNMGLKWYSTL